jgi:hypothetical protein
MVLLSTVIVSSRHKLCSDARPARRSAMSFSCSRIPKCLCSPQNQHIRKMRVRGRVLQQRRPPPAIRRLAEAPLPVQPLPLLELSFALRQ